MEEKQVDHVFSHPIRSNSIFQDIERPGPKYPTWHCLAFSGLFKVHSNCDVRIEFVCIYQDTQRILWEKFLETCTPAKKTTWCIINLTGILQDQEKWPLWKKRVQFGTHYACKNTQEFIMSYNFLFTSKYFL